MKGTDGENVVMTPEETAFIDAFVGERCVPHEQVIARRLDAWCARMQQAVVSAPTQWRLAAAGGVLSPLRPTVAPESPVSPEETVRFVFASQSERPGRAWRAELTIPPKASVGTMLPVRVTGLGIDAVPDGVLSLAGCQIPLQNGEGGILFDIFLSGIRNARVSLRRPDGTIEDGRLMFL